MMKASEPDEANAAEAAAAEENHDADTAPGPQGDHLPSDEPHQIAEEQLNRHYGSLRQPNRSRGD